MRKRNYFKGLVDCLPIALGYYAVSITIGVAAVSSGLGIAEAGLASFTSFSSAGEFAGFSVIAASGSFIEMAVMQLIINARYILMSAALSQKLEENTGIIERLIMGLGVTDEIFGLSIAVPGRLSPYYTFGVISLTIPAWTLGTLTGAVLGSIMPDILISAFSVSLYGMFIAVFIPPARKSKIIGGLVVISFALSYIFNKLPMFDFISNGTKIIILTALISLVSAVLFPIKEEDDV